jgi:hypothetical protein
MNKLAKVIGNKSGGLIDNGFADGVQNFHLFNRGGFVDGDERGFA